MVCLSSPCETHATGSSQPAWQSIWVPLKGTSLNLCSALGRSEVTRPLVMWVPVKVGSGSSVRKRTVQISRYGNKAQPAVRHTSHSPAASDSILPAYSDRPRDLSLVEFSECTASDNPTLSSCEVAVAVECLMGLGTMWRTHASSLTVPLRSAFFIDLKVSCSALRHSLARLCAYRYHLTCQFFIYRLIRFYLNSMSRDSNSLMAWL